jgi:HEPN domain-containing protein
MRCARSDLASAKLRLPSEEVLLESLCFHTQQSVEKSLKAVLIHLKIAFPRTHNIVFLLDLLPPEVPRALAPEEAAALTDYAVTSRYPGEAEDVTEEELLTAIDVAVRVLAWASRIVGS